MFYIIAVWKRTLCTLCEPL